MKRKLIIRQTFLIAILGTTVGLVMSALTACTSYVLNPPRNVESTIPYVQEINQSEVPIVGEEYFLRHNIWTIPARSNSPYVTKNYSYHVTGEHPTTNYSTGKFLPINTRVIVLLLTNKYMVLGLPESKVEITRMETDNSPVTGMPTFKRVQGYDAIRISNVSKYSEKNMAEVARNMLSSRAIPLDKLDADIAKAIKLGYLKTGMTKDEVLMARGFPPGHRTFTLESDRWIYWRTRMATQELEFENNKLVKGIR